MFNPPLVVYFPGYATGSSYGIPIVGFLFFIATELRDLYQ